MALRSSASDERSSEDLLELLEGMDDLEELLEMCSSQGPIPFDLEKEGVDDEDLAAIKVALINHLGEPFNRDASYGWITRKYAPSCQWFELSFIAYKVAAVLARGESSVLSLALSEPFSLLSASPSLPLLAQCTKLWPHVHVYCVLCSPA